MSSRIIDLMMYVTINLILATALLKIQGVVLYWLLLQYDTIMPCLVSLTLNGMVMGAMPFVIARLFK